MSDDSEAPNILDYLPVVKFFQKCQNCGANDWDSCRLEPSNRVVLECNKCPGQPADWSPIDD